MTDDRLEGFVTRPEAADRFNRSQRALERELAKALTEEDELALSHWMLTTKDGETREANQVSAEMVKQLQADGKLPVWYVSESYLELKYGRKGTPKPTKSEQKTETAKPVAGEESGGSKSDEQTVTAPKEVIPSDVEFLKERIRTLEREKREEIDRNEKREAKLFEQLEVKDRQISAWDELSQGLTKGLATGQLRPGSSNEVSGSKQTTNTSDDVIEADIIPAEVKKPAVKKPKARSKPSTKSKPKKATAKWYNKPVSEFFKR